MKQCTLGDLVTFQRGYDLPKASMVTGKYPVVGSQGIIGFHNEYTTETPSITVGRSGNVGNPFIYYGRSWSHNTTLYVKEFHDCDPVFVYYFLKTLHLENYAGGSAVPTLNRNHIHTIDVTVPSDIEEQIKIGNILKMIDDKIDVNKRINDNLQQQAEAIFKAWFCDFILNDGLKPALWEITQLDNLTTLVARGITPRYDDTSDQIILNQKCIRAHNIDLSLARHHSPKDITNKWLQHGDLLINSTGEGTLGRMAQVWFYPEKMTVDSHITIVRPLSNLLKYYIGFWGFSHEAVIESLHTGSTGQTELPRERLKALQILLPDKETLTRFNDIIKPITQAIVRNQEENSRLIDIRNTLLPRLMSGEIDVSGIDS